MVACPDVVDVSFVLWRSCTAIHDNFVAFGGEVELICGEARYDLAFATLFARLFVVFRQCPAEVTFWLLAHRNVVMNFQYAFWILFLLIAGAAIGIERSSASWGEIRRSLIADKEPTADMVLVKSKLFHG